MINLLPDTEKQNLLFEKNKNLIIVLASITVIFLICLALVLFALKFYILQKVDYQKEILKNAEDRYHTREFSSLLESLRDHNSNILKADIFYKRNKYLSPILKKVLDIDRSSAIVFDSLSLDRSESDLKIKVSIYGTSKTRDDLIIFKNNIEKASNVNNVNLPPDSLVKPSNVSFYLSFEVVE
ncbi:MAG: hypothetical protein FJZ43_01615 [Candidatus Staskawiczbacteria bacterium]|nr:hypothetical protein [Candidatus Staskawiczbacteria bacterium]